MKSILGRMHRNMRGPCRDLCDAISCSLKFNECIMAKTIPCALWLLTAAGHYNCGPSRDTSQDYLTSFNALRPCCGIHALNVNRTTNCYNIILYRFVLLEGSQGFFSVIFAPISDTLPQWNKVLHDSKIHWEKDSYLSATVLHELTWQTDLCIFWRAF